MTEYLFGTTRFIPDGNGGGTLLWKERVVRKGFRPQVVQRSIHKEAHHGGQEASSEVAA